MGQKLGQRFGRVYRLTRPEEFRFATRRARRISRECFAVWFRANRRGHPRLGLAIARRHVRSAPHRNLVKRIVRESFRRHRPRLGAYDIVFTSRPALKEKDKEQLHVMVDEIFKEIESCDAS